MGNAKFTAQLQRLARLYGVQTYYVGADKKRHEAGPESLLGVLRALGAPVNKADDIPAAIRERTAAMQRQVIEPVTVIREGEPDMAPVNLPVKHAGTKITCRLETENGYISEWSKPIQPVAGGQADGGQYVTGAVTFPHSLPMGYHRLTIKCGKLSGATHIISAPGKVFTPFRPLRRWGGFLPLYALQDKHTWGAGDYTALGRLADWLGEKGGGVLGTLPLLPLFLDEPFEPSPYTPVSRLFWNEFYADVTAAPEYEALGETEEIKKKIAALRGGDRVDYRGVMAVKRQAMQAMCRALLSRESPRRAAFARFERENPAAEKYAGFRAVMTRRRQVWTDWPERLRRGDIGPSDYDEDEKNYHLYAQWLAQEQVAALAEKTRGSNMSLYFDLPLGVHAAGFDTWRYGDSFALEARAGAPPDAVFTGGQDWGFPPLHPERIRSDGYRYVRAYLQHHLRCADMLRIDHVMGLHRLFWIPPGAGADNGVYVKYRPEEFYAVLAVESHRANSVIVGEDLGIVPSYVRRDMARHGLERMYVLYYELAEDAEKALRGVPENAVAALNTHDMAPFAAFWAGLDIDERREVGLTDKAGAVKEKRQRESTKKSLEAFLYLKKLMEKTGGGARPALEACLGYLSGSSAATVLVNLEDLWLETRSQNMPGVGDRFPAWQRKARYALEEFSRLPEVSAALKSVAGRRDKEG